MTQQHPNPRDLIKQLAGLARRKHYTCEDSWYNCPKSEDGSANDDAGTECDCGADEHNAKVDAICAYLAQPEPEGPTDEPLGDLIDKWVQEAFCKKPHGCKHPTHTYVACKAWEHGRNHAARTALKPVPVSERLPGEGDYDPSFQCWWFTPSEEKWILWPIKWAGPECSHWLPHYSLPVPTQHS